MRTEYAETMMKDFNTDALRQITEEAAKRADWCYEEVDRRKQKPDLWSFEDVQDLRADAEKFQSLHFALRNLRT